jgi:D-amino-acid dehydrogenase
MTARKRVLVVGGGVVGLSVAWHCARKGHEVTVLDRGTADSDGASVANAGMVVPSHFIPLAAPGVVQLGLKWMWNPESPFHVKPRLSAELFGWGWKLYRAATPERVERVAPLLRDLHLASRACFEEWAALWGNRFELVRKGLLVLCNTEHGFDEEARAAEHAHRLGLPAEVLRGSEVAKREPGVRMDVAGAVYHPLDCHLTPERLMTALRDDLTDQGVQIMHRTEVCAWRRRNGHIAAVETAEGDIQADEFVLCAGFWSTQIARELGLRLPMQAGKGYSLTVEDPPVHPQLCAILSEARVAMTPMGRAVRFGGTMELTTADEGVNPARIRGIVKSVTRYYPDVAPSHLETARIRSGLRPCPPDGLPYVGRLRGQANLAVATGHAMMGVSLAPITGKLVAELVSGETPSLPIEALSPERYQ